MRKVSVLLMVLVVSVAFAAACSKTQNNSSSTTTTTASAEATAAPTAAATEQGMSNAASSPMAMSNTKLPIPLSKLPSITVAAGDAAAGAKVFSANCESCHGAGGKNGTVGPSLAGIGIKPGQVAYMVTNPTGVDKDSGMPKLPLSSKDVADVAAYVASLK
ncbi:MAG: cytochrome c [Candidatus Eremiobacteraeota bacterium]|nr:cytochrome c [Candidatus Eremiobacteraeota bacterium]MBV8367228.1 cytochrome c [Candidatus Eremiobacteraeota bacterium]